MSIIPAFTRHNGRYGGDKARDPETTEEKYAVPLVGLGAMNGPIYGLDAILM